MSLFTADSIRATVQVYNLEGSVTGETPMPAVFKAPIRSDIVHFVHTNMNKNSRVAYGRKHLAGREVAAESWGPGRAVARIPRVGGSGTGRSGQGAFGNMCRGGHMYSPLRTTRKWHRKTPVNMKRYAVASALAASAVPAFVMSRGHAIEQVKEVPLVMTNCIESITKTKDAMALLEKVGAAADVMRCKEGKNVRAGKGTMRNRKYKTRVGPLVIYNADNGIHRAFRAISGVDVACVDRLNLLQLCPGGHLGRFCVWSQAAFEKLDAVFGTQTTASQLKKGYTLPAATSQTGDLLRILNSEEVIAVTRAPKNSRKYSPLKRNPLKNKQAMAKLSVVSSKTMQKRMNKA